MQTSQCFGTSTTASVRCATESWIIPGSTYRHMRIDQFIKEVRSGEDTKRVARAAFREQEFPNSDGTVAENILHHVRIRLRNYSAGLLM